MEEFRERIEDYKTSTSELDKVLVEYDIDAGLEQEFDTLCKALIQLEIKYQSLLNSRRFLKDATT